MSFKRNFMDQDDNNDDSQVFQKRSRFGDEGGFRGRGRGGDRRGGDRGRGGFRGRGGGGGGRGNFRGRGGFNRDGDDQDNGGRMSFRGRGRGGGRGFGDRGFGDRSFGDRGFGDRGRGRGGDRGRGGRGRFGDRGFGDRRGGNFRGRGRGGGGGDRSNFSQRECNIKVGQDAPTFENIIDDKSNPVSLDQFKGQYVVLFIYFKDGTYGCSIEQKNFNDVKGKFDKYNAVILGVSRDDEDTHKATIEQQKLTYSLLSDTDSKICQAYGAIDERDRITRSTFLISPQSKVVGVWPKVFSFETHAEEVLAKLEEVVNGKSDTKDGEHGDKDDDDNDNGENEEDDDQEKDDEEEEDDEQQGDDDDDDDA